MFSTLPKSNLNFSVTCILSANAFDLYQSKILSFGKELIKDTFENIEGKGENDGDQHFLLFPYWFYPIIGKSSF